MTPDLRGLRTEHRTRKQLCALALAALVVGAGIPAAAFTVGADGAGNTASTGGDGEGGGGGGSVAFPIELPGEVAGGVAGDGEHIYAVVDAGEREEVVKIDPASEEVVERYALPTDRASGLAINGSTLWAVDLNSDAVMRIDTETGEGEVAFRATGAPSGVAVANGSLWIGDIAADKVFEFGFDGEYRGQFAVEDHTRTVRSLTATGGSLWVGDGEDEVSPPGLTEFDTDGTFLGTRNTSTTNDAIAATKWGLLAPTAEGEVRVAIDTVAPAADAGGNREVAERAAVELDGTGTAVGIGGNLSLEWTQTAGPSVSLTNGSTATPEFTAPTVEGNTTLTFELNASDGNGNFDTDTVNVSVVDLGATGDRSDGASVFTAGQTKRNTITVESDLAVEVRDTVPIEWKVYNGSDVERVVVDEQRGVKQVYLNGTASGPNATTYTYYVRAPEQTGRYDFGPAEVRATGFGDDAGWVSLDGTTGTNTVVGVDQNTASSSGEGGTSTAATDPTDGADGASAESADTSGLTDTVEEPKGSV